MKRVRKELIIYLVIFVIASIVMHFDSWLSHPVEHMSALFTHSMAYHPLLYAFLIYIVIAVFRAIINLIRKLFKK